MSLHKIIFKLNVDRILPFENKKHTGTCETLVVNGSINKYQ